MAFRNIGAPFRRASGILVPRGGTVPDADLSAPDLWTRRYKLRRIEEPAVEHRSLIEDEQEDEEEHASQDY